MTKNIILFLAAFIGGAVIALAARSALFKPYAEQSGHPPVAESPAMIGSGAQAAPPAPAADPHAGHTMAPASENKPVNTVCAICGMDVDPSIKPAEYKGKLVGFGCRACPPRFAREPDRYGPAALENKVVEN